MISNKALYETFHKSTLSQKKLINKNNFTYRIILRVLQKYLSSGSVLDIGCGAGTIDFYLARQGFQVTGIDISESAIKSAKKTSGILNLKNVKFTTMNFPIDVPPGKFSNVICMEVVEHLKDDKKAFEQIFKLLEKSGIAIISTPSKNAPVYKAGLANKFDKRVGHLRRYTQAELIELAEASGFIIIDTLKSEGVIRNFLFINPVAGKFVRFVKGPLVHIVSFIDYITLKLFGESDLFIIAKKP